MITLLNEALAPVTSGVGFLRVDLNRAADALRNWRAVLHGADRVSAQALSGDLVQLVSALQPLTGGGRPRELLVGTASPEWTAYLDCGLTGTDAESTIGHLSQVLGCSGVVACAIPHTYGTGHEDPGRYGAVKLIVFGPEGAPPLGYVRVVYAQHDGARWVFGADGQVQEYETPERYGARRVRDRFTSQLLAQYCAALGIQPFVAEFYGPEAVLMNSPFSPPPGAKVGTLAESQKWFGIRPGIADSISG